MPDRRLWRAVLIGTSTYRAKNLEDLPAVRRNLLEMENVLTDPSLGGLDPKHCEMILDWDSLHDAGERLQSMTREARGVLIVYYAGHGLLDPQSKLHLALRNTSREHPQATGLPIEWVKDAIKDSPAGIRVLILDCCFSGRAIEGMPDRTYILAATPPNERAQPGERHTAFTGELLKLLREGSPGTSEPLTLEALFPKLERALIERRFPRPQRGDTNNAGQLTLSQVIHDGSPPRIPPPKPGRIKKVLGIPKSRRNVWKAAAVLVLLALGTAATPWIFGRDTSCPETSSIGNGNTGDGVLSFGTLSSQRPQIVAGAKMAIKEIKDNGGITADVEGPKLDPANERDSGNGTTDVACTSVDALLPAEVDTIIGPSSSPVTEKVIGKVIASRVILFSPSVTAPLFSKDTDEGFFFRTIPSDRHQGRVLGKLVVEDGNSSVALISVDNAYGNGIAEATGEAIHDAGGRVVDSVKYRLDQENFDDEVERLASADPDAVVVLGHFREAPEILKAMIGRELGPKNRNVYGADGNMRVNLARQVNPRDPGILTGMRGTNPLATGTGKFFDRLKSFDPSLQQLTYAAESYDAVVVTALAAVKAGTDAPEEIAREINGVTRGGEKCTSFADCKRLLGEGKDIDYDGPSGLLDFNGNGEPDSGDYLIQEFQPDGSLRDVGKAVSSEDGKVKFYSDDPAN